jgi:hypothetical protein
LPQTTNLVNCKCCTISRPRSMLSLPIRNHIDRLYTFGITEPPLNWLQSYPTDISQFVRIGSAKPVTRKRIYCVPFPLGLLLFSLIYVAKFGNNISSCRVSHAQYGDDMQLCIGLHDTAALSAISDCMIERVPSMIRTQWNLVKYKQV